MLHCAATYAGHLRHRPPSDARLGRPTWKPHHDSTQDVRPAARGDPAAPKPRRPARDRRRAHEADLSDPLPAIWDHLARRRRYDRGNPLSADIPNQAINHASVAVTAAAVIAVTAVGAIPQLGFIHEHSGEAFALDVGDLFRDTILLPAALKSAKAVMDDPTLNIERHTRRTTGELLRTERVISKMIDRIKALFDDVVVPTEASASVEEREDGQA